MRSMLFYLSGKPMVEPLTGIKVLDLSMNAPGPLASMLLADFGADVTHIIRPGLKTFAQTYGGDIADDPYINSRFQPYDAIMRNKRSLALNLKDDRGKEIFLKMVEQADVLIEEFRPGKLEKLGLGYSQLKSHNSRLIYCSVTGYGQTGPMRDAAGHDINYLAMTGALDMIRSKDQMPINPQNILSDNGGASMSAVVGILLALIQRSKTGMGQYIDANCTDSVIYLMADLYSTALGGQHKSSDFRETFSNGLPNYRSYRCADDKWLSIGALEAHFCQTLFNALELPDLMHKLDDKKRWPELIRQLESVFASQTRDHWLEKLSGLDACVTPVLTLEEVAEHPQTRARKSIVQACGVPQVGIAPKLSASPGSIKSKPATPGSHSQEILKTFGLSAKQFQQLKKAGITE